MNRRVALLATAGVAVVAGGIALVALPAQAATGCKVSYTISSQWPGGFGANVAVTNLGDPLTSWTLKWTFPDANQKVTQGWNGSFSQSGTAVTVTNMSWNGSLGTNATITPGFNGSWSGANPVPTSFSLNGVTCTGGTTTTAPTTARTATTAPTTARTTAPTTPATTGPTQPAGAAPALHVSGNKLVTSSGASYRLLGVNRSGGEFACIQGSGMWNGPMDQASIDAMKTWKVRAVRVPLNEECWLGTSNVPSGQPSGATYQQNVKTYTNLLLSNGITPILEMHWNYGQYSGQGAGCSDAKASCQKPMPDAQYAPQFWTSMANTFKDTRIIFDLFNEPYPDAAANWDATAAWKCWRDGGTCPGISYQVAGFQSLVNAVRATGNSNVIMIGGLRWSNDISQWLAYKPTDSTGNLAAFAHIYNFNACIDTSCWDREWAPVAASVPLNITEVGENDCAHSFVDTVFNWADTKGVGYLGWTWNNWDCSSGPSLITDYNGTATNFGLGLKNRLATATP